LIRRVKAEAALKPRKTDVKAASRSWPSRLPNIR
jgi:hypothetical protein